MANKSLYVGNISYSATEESLKSAFAAYSPSVVRIIEGRGFAFVEVAADQMEAAIEGMNGKSVEGRNLTVNEAKPRENSGGGGAADGTTTAAAPPAVAGKHPRSTPRPRDSTSPGGLRVCECLLNRARHVVRFPKVTHKGATL